MRALPVRHRGRTWTGHRFVGHRAGADGMDAKPVLAASASSARRGADPVGDLHTTLRQSVTPPRLLGRVTAINILSYGARPVGAALGALVGGL